MIDEGTSDEGVGDKGVGVGAGAGDRGGIKTSQPFSDELKDTSSPGTDTKPKPRPDALGDPEKKAESPKTTQRSE